MVKIKPAGSFFFCLDPHFDSYREGMRAIASCQAIKKGYNAGGFDSRTLKSAFGGALMPNKKPTRQSSGMTAGERDVVRAKRWQRVLFIGISVLVLLSMVISLIR